MTFVRVVESGFASTIQDLGRFGWRKYGLCASGAMDREAHILANWLVGNSPDKATLEITATGPVLAFDHDGYLAVCGGDMGPRLNGHAIKQDQTVPYHEGDIVSFHGPRIGFRANIAFWGGIDIPTTMGSRSTTQRAGIGGLSGQTLKQGDLIPIGEALHECSIRRIPAPFIHSWSPPAELRIMPGPEIDRFETRAIISLLTSPYRVSAQSDRMGMRLEGKRLSLRKPADIISAGIPVGTVQVAANGLPMITLSDGQPTGGYARLACVFAPDQWLLAQTAPGDYLRFREIRPHEALRHYLQRVKLFRRLTGISPYRP